MKAILAFDDFVLNRSDNTKRVFKQPEWKFDHAFNDPNNQRGFSLTSVVPAPQGGYMMLYNGVPDPNLPVDDEHMACLMAWSPDGLHFEPYKLNTDAKYPHVRGLACDDIGMHVSYDAAETNPEMRYKAPHPRYGYQGDKLVEGPAYLLGSADLIHWKRITDAEVTPSYVDCYLSVLRNPVTGRYQVTTRRRWGERRICLVESEDLQSWTTPRAIVHPLPDDEPLTHLYSMPHYYYEPGEIFIGLLWKQVMPFARIMDGPVITEYAYSYDGLMWNRTNARMFPKMGRGELGGGSNYVTAMVDRGDDIIFYCNACYAEHGGMPEKPKAAMPPAGFANPYAGANKVIPGILKKNRFVCIDSGKGKAELMTQWLRLKKPELNINANIPFGSLKAELRIGNRAIEGFGMDDFEPIVGDHIDTPLRWKGDLNKVLESGAWFQLHITFEQAEVYAITGDFDFTINTRAPAYERL